MRTKDFLIQLSGVTLATAALLFLLRLFPETSPYLLYGWICLSVFVALSLMMFFTGYIALDDKNKQGFVRVSLLFTAIKMLVSVVLNFVYYKASAPETAFFLLPFFIVYLIYTVFETRFMMLLGKYGINPGK